MRNKLMAMVVGILLALGLSLASPGTALAYSNGQVCTTSYAGNSAYAQRTFDGYWRWVSPGQCTDAQFNYGKIRVGSGWRVDYHLAGGSGTTCIGPRDCYTVGQLMIVTRVYYTG